MFAIGEFARLARVTVKALRHYDELGLLKPRRVDTATGYRYYSAEQLPRLNRILVLKDLGFSLPATASLLDAGISVEELRGILRLRLHEQETRVAAETARLRALEVLIENLAKETTAMDVLVKQSPEGWLVSCTGRVERYSAIGPLYAPVFRSLGARAAQALCVAIWHEDATSEDGILAEAGALLSEKVEAIPPAATRWLEAETVASYVHHGSFERLKSAYDGLLAWLERTDFAPSGPARELYLKIGANVRQDDESYVTEIQIPVRSNAAK